MKIDRRAFREAVAKTLLAVGVLVTIVSMLVVTHQGMLHYVHRR